MTNWLRHFAGQSLGNFEATPELDRELSRRALAARTDLDERDALYILLAYKVERFVARFRSWRLEPYSLDDVEQASFTVFTDTIRRWEPRYESGEPAGYLFYFLRVFPLRLSNEVSRLTGRRQPVPLALFDDGPEPPDPTPSDREALGSAIVDDLCERLSAEEANLLRLHVVAGQPLSRAARELGIARRTAYRRWHNIVEIGRKYLEEAG